MSIRKSSEGEGIPFSIILGFVIALLAMGLPLIGVTVNLYLGCACLLVALFLLIYGLWKWEKISHWQESARTSVIWLFALAFISLAGWQVRSQYLKDHSQTPVSLPGQPNLVNSSLKGAETAPPPQPVVQPKHHIATSHLESLVQPPPQAPTYGGQTCIGSACAQGPGSQAVLNQFGAQKFNMNEAQGNVLRDAIKPFAPVHFEIVIERPTSATNAFATQLCRALKEAGMDIQPETTDCSGLFLSIVPYTGAVPGGLYMFSNEDQDLLAGAIATSLQSTGVLKEKLHVDHRNSHNVTIKIASYE